MRFEQLRLENLRNIAALELELGAGLNLFLGANGAGKTSILEGAYLLSHAQSFRSGLADTLIRRGSDNLAVSAQLRNNAGAVRIGLGRNADGWSARLHGRPAPNLGAMLRECAVVCFEPGSHALISGGSGERRRFLDWGVFHVEPDFLARARQYARVLRQRNMALKQSAGDSELDAWDMEMAAAAGPMTVMRANYFSRYALELLAVLGLFLPELGAATCELTQGWSAEESLANTLVASRARDRARGHTTRGPHRADWTIRFEQAPLREHLSRGQEKLCALACVLAQARMHAVVTGEWPIIALDDLASELDSAHQKLVVDLLCAASAQVLISGIEVPDCLRHISSPIRMFHVEHGQAHSLL